MLAYRLNNEGLGMRMIDYHIDSDTVDVMFDDGVVIRGVSYQRFLAGEVYYPDTNYLGVKEKAKSPLKGKEKAKSVFELLREERLGEVNTNNAGMRMKIIRYGNYNDIDVQFEDGVVATHRKYSAFKRGVISKSKLPANMETCRASRVGEVGVNNSGLKMTIIRYGSANDVDVQFEDGTVVTNKSYCHFKDGSIRNPSANNLSESRVGEVGVNNSGLKMTIIRYGNYNDIDVQFEDGTVVKNKTYGSFIKGKIRKGLLDRTGEVGLHSSGMKMTIIRYGGPYDIDVQFEDGTIVRNKEYGSFKQGYIKRPSESRLGEVNTNNAGMQMKIIRYGNSSDIDVQFEDGTVVKNKRYGNFKNGYIRKPFEGESDSKVGEVNTNNDGMRMKIIRYGEYGDIDVQFEDGTIVKDKAYDAFKNGSIKNPSKGKESWESRVGEVSVHNSTGMKMKIIRYGGYNDIDVQFEDGTIAKNKSYANFKNGKIGKSLTGRVGEVGLHSSGAKMTIIRYGSSSDIDVQFEDGTIARHKDYKLFKQGYIKRPSESRLGEVNTNNDGMQMKIIRYGDYNDIDVQFEDGTVVKNKSYANFKKGYIIKPFEGEGESDSKVGEVGVHRSGLKMKIIRFRAYHDIDVQFEDGTVARNQTYASFENGSIRKPTISWKSRESRLGEVNTNNAGMRMKIVKYGGANDIDVQFEDGTIAKNKAYSSFKNGSIRKPPEGKECWESRVGEVRTNNAGLKMKIIRYGNASDIDVQFEDGTIVRNRAYNAFTRGRIMKSLGNEKDANRARVVDRTGEVRVHSSGMKMKIIRYLNSGDIDVQFEDGTIVKHKQYASFKKGTISKPIDRLGEEGYNNDGLKMKIIRYGNSCDIDVQFKDGTIVRNRTYADFKNGCIRRN